jgi:hypothetical protein
MAPIRTGNDLIDARISMKGDCFRLPADGIVEGKGARRDGESVSRNRPTAIPIPH